jgi:hypothetical protein
VAQGSLEQLRAGVEAQAPAGAGESAALAAGEKLTLEQIFLRTVGGEQRSDPELSWLE